MHIICAHTFPDGLIANWHQVLRVTARASEATATIASFENEGDSSPIWQWEHPIPQQAIAGDPVGDAARFLVSAEGPLASGSVVDPEGNSLLRARQKASSEIKAKRDAEEWGGCDTPFGRVDSDPGSQRKVSGAVTMAMILGEEFNISFRMADNTSVALDSAGMIQVGLLVGQHVSACQGRKDQLDALVAAAESVDEINTIAINEGWP